MKKILIFIALMAQVVLFCTCDKEINHSKLPTVTTTFPTLEDGKLFGGGAITDNGGSNITDKGICIAGRYNISDPFGLDHCYTSINAGSGDEAFAVDLTSLYNEFDVYHGEVFKIRAYATNKTGTAYGEVLSVSLTGFGTLYVFDIGQNSAIASVDITSRNDVQECGFCWSTSSNPSINNSSTVASWVNNHYRATLTGLQPNTRYYVKAYVKDNYGISYSSEVNFVTLQACPTSVQDYDGNTYGVVSIGSQCWMKENLRTTHLKNGGNIGLVTSDNGGSSSTPERYYPNGNSSNVNSYGYLYNYATVVKDPCPQGWHVPSYNEMPLANGGDLKATGTTYWNYPNTGATNSSGFTAYGGGYRFGGGGFYRWKEIGVWWTHSEYNSNYSYDFSLGYDRSYLASFGDSNYDYAISRGSGLSIRCVKDGSKGTTEFNPNSRVEHLPGVDASEVR